MIDLAQIQQQYPNPVAYTGEHQLTEYCVGGALCLSQQQGKDWGQMEQHFPGREHLADVLAALNPALDARTADTFAHQIVTRNDLGKFPDAWQAVYAALAYPAQG